MQLFKVTLIIMLGLIIGSFLNVCIYRIPKNENIAFPPSHCFECGNNLSLLDLVPVFSYILLRGKCRYCKNNMSLQYPLIELANSLVYVLLFMYFGLTVKFIFLASLSSILIVISIIDYYHKIIPDKINLMILILGMFYKLTNILIMRQENDLLDSLFGFAIGGGIFLSIAIITGAMGGGDIKLMAALGIWFGTRGIAMVTLLSFAIGAVVSIILLITKIKTRKDEIPFAPFISIASMITILYLEPLIHRYLNLSNYL